MVHQPSVFKSAFATAIFLMLLAGQASAAPAHPHLFYTSSDVATLQARITDPFYQHVYDEIITECRYGYGPGETIPASSPLRNAKALMCHGTLLLVDPTGRAINDNYQSNTRFLSYYNATLNLSGWSDFFGNSELDSSFLLIALCIGYDMHYDKFTSSQRTDIINKLADRADYIIDVGKFSEVPTDLATSIRHRFTLLRNSNLIPVGALGMIAYTLEGEVSETRRQRWLAKVDEILAAWDTYVSHDGMSHEGYSYHEYMIRSLFPMLYARSRRTGVNQFTRYAYMKNHPIYSIYSWIPGGDRSFIQPMPFGDCDTAPPSPMPTNIALSARMLKGNSAHLDQLANWMQYKVANGVPNCSYYRVEPLQIIWADSSITPKSPQQLDLPRFHYFPERGAFVWRSGWDNMATYFAMMCGPTIGGHQHPEMGNFVIHKGGSPFIAHHGYSKSRRTEDNNVMMINGLGQYGDRWDDGGGTTHPEPPENWASIKRVIGDNDYFNVFANMKPVYRDVNVTSYTREFTYAGGVFFVMDQLKMNSGVYVNFNSILNAYSTTQPELNPNSYCALDIDSNPTANPWAGSGRTHTITPRQSGPFTGSMTVKDLSRESWSPAVTESIVNNEDNEFVKRGYRLVLSRLDNYTELLMAFYFPQSGRTVEAWPAATVGTGFMIKSGTTVQALGVWSLNGSVTNSSGLTMTGAFGGLDLTANSYWGRDLKTLQYNGRTYISSNNPVSIFCALTPTGERIRFSSDKSATVSLYVPTRPTAVKLNSATLSSSYWSWSNNVLKLTLSAQPSQALIEASWPKNAVPESSWALYR